MATGINAAVVGCTGLVGGHILSTLLSLPQISKVSTYSRRTPKTLPTTPITKLDAFAVPESKKWAPHLLATTPAPEIFLSALGTTRATAGGFENQYKIDHDLNIELARAAKDAGVRVYGIISSAGTSKDSMMPYGKLKGEIEESVKAIGFEHTIILRPGYLMGDREEGRAVEVPLRFVAGLMGRISTSLTDFWAQDAEVVSRAAVHASLLCVRGEREKGVWSLTQSEIVRLGRTEWPMGGAEKQ